MRKKFLKWVRRYLPSEIIGTLTLLVSTTIVQRTTQNALAIALAGTWGDNLGFYGHTAVREIINCAKRYKKSHGIEKYFLISSKISRNLIFEFGPAEFFDSFLVSPFFMYTIPKLVGDFTTGILLAKVAADIVFYGINITSYKLREKYELEHELREKYELVYELREKCVLAYELREKYELEYELRKKYAVA